MPVRFIALAVLAIVNVALLGSVYADKLAIRSKKKEIIRDDMPRAEAVKVMAEWVRDEVYHCGPGDVEQMPMWLRWNYRHNPFRIGPVTVLRSGGDATGACGSSSRVLMELLAAHDVRSRFAIIGGPDGETHTVLEVFYEDAWGLVDPLYNIVYQRGIGQPASLDDLRADPELYVSNAKRGWEWQYQPPPRVRHAYNASKYPISSARYFNYDKFGALSRGLYRVLDAALGDQGTLLIKRPNFYAYPALTLVVVLDALTAGLLGLFACAQLIRRRRASTKTKQAAQP